MFRPEKGVRLKAEELDVEGRKGTCDGEENGAADGEGQGNRGEKNERSAIAYQSG